jgi:RimJ/RimL family protein N-acetyltransferase
MSPVVHLRDFTSADLSLLETWLARPHVSAFWPEPEWHLTTARDLPTRYRHAVIELEGAPIGYLRWAYCPRDVLDRVGFPELPENCVDVDILIGEEAACGRGVGPRALQKLLTVLDADPSVPLVSMITAVVNQRAIRAYEKSGFRAYREVQEKGVGPCLVMVRHRVPPADEVGARS